MELRPGEQVVFDAHPSWRAILGFYAKGVLVALVVGAVLWVAVDPVAGVLAFAVLELAVMAAGFVKRSSTRYVVTTERLHVRRGRLSRATEETGIERVQHVATRQSVLERVLGVGTVDFDTAGDDGSSFVFGGVDDPERVVRAVDEARRRAPGS